MHEQQEQSARWWVAALVVAFLVVMTAVPLGVTALMTGMIAAERAHHASTACDPGQGSVGKQIYASSGKVRLPLTGKFKFTSEFGMRVQPKLRVNRLHAGIDLAMIPTGGDVLAAMDGTVQSVNPNTPGAGNYVVISHGKGVVTRYLHMASMSVRPGQKVKVGQKIGVEGNTTGGTGISTGAHLHFEVHKGGEPVDPVAWLAKNGIDLPAEGGIASAASVTGESATSSGTKKGKKKEYQGVEVNTGPRGQGFSLPAPDMGARRNSKTTEPMPIPKDHMRAYKAAAKKFGLPWELLAGVGMEETHHGRIKAISSAGAMGPMQFMPATWASMGIDGDGDGEANILDLQDSVFSAAKYLAQSGATTSAKGVKEAIFAYNHADFYVADVLYYSMKYGSGQVTVTPSGTTAASGPCGRGTPQDRIVSASACVTRIRQGMTPQQRAGQLIMAAMRPGSTTSLDRYINKHGLGNMLYLGDWQDASTVKAASQHLQKTAPTVDGTTVGMLVAADQEGGQVQVLTGQGFSSMPSAMEQAQMPDLRSAAKKWGQELKNAGINVNLAPVADTVPAKIGKGNAPIGKWDRQYGSDPKKVGHHVRAFAKGMQAAGVEPTIKHFPGIGRITGNTDLTADGVTDSKMTADDPHLQPFDTAIDGGAQIVMVGSARYPELDGDTPAVFSKKIITNLLRQRMGFGGVVFTDDVGAAESVAATPVPQRATKTVAAGGDVILTAQPSQVPTMVTALTSKAKQDPAFRKKIRASVTRVLGLKEDMGLLQCDDPASQAATQEAEKREQGTPDSPSGPGSRLPVSRKP